MHLADQQDTHFTSPVVNVFFPPPSLLAPELSSRCGARHDIDEAEQGAFDLRGQRLFPRAVRPFMRPHHLSSSMEHLRSGASDFS